MTVAQYDLFGGETVAAGPSEGPRFAYACQRCAEWFFADIDMADDYGTAKVNCPICHGNVTLRGRVNEGKAVADYEVPACDDRCTGARGVVCVCQCGGRNHGSHRMVIVTVDLGGRPKLDLAAGSKLAGLSAKRLPEIERAETLAAELVDSLEELYWEPLTERRAGRWLDAAAYSRIREWEHYRAEIRHAQRLKVPANRVKKLTELARKINA